MLIESILLLLVIFNKLLYYIFKSMTIPMKLAKIKIIFILILNIF